MKEKKIIVIEGIDGSGKETQSKLLLDFLKKEGYKTMMKSFPDYQNYSSKPIKRLLTGEIKPDIYQAASLYAMDRYVFFNQGNHLSFLNDPYYDIGIMDRYTTSNLLYQASRAMDKEKDPKGKEMLRIANWIEEYEYDILSIPKPDIVFYLKLPVSKALSLIKERGEKKAGTKKDIYETEEILTRSYETAIFMANKKGWNVIDCFDEKKNEILPIEAIHEKIKEVALQNIKK